MSSFQSMFRPVMTVLSAPTYKVRVQARAAPEIAVTLANRPKAANCEMRRVMMCSFAGCLKFSSGYSRERRAGRVNGDHAYDAVNVKWRHEVKSDSRPCPCRWYRRQ